MLVSASALLLAIASLAALEPVTAFPLGTSPGQVPFSRFRLTSSLKPGCFYTCPPLTDEIPVDFGVDANDTQGEPSADGVSTICRYSSFSHSEPIACTYDDTTGRLLSSVITPLFASSTVSYDGCALFALAKNDRGRGTCVRPSSEKAQDEQKEVARQRLKAAQWSREKLQRREQLVAQRKW